MLAVNKFSSLDPSGMGVEMEGGKPGWNDAMNGLPGLIGSGMPETYEMLRILNYLTSALPKFDRAVHFPVEFVDFMSALGDAMVTANAAEPSDESDFAYW